MHCDGLERETYDGSCNGNSKKIFLQYLIVSNTNIVERSPSSETVDILPVLVKHVSSIHYIKFKQVLKQFQFNTMNRNSSQWDGRWFYHRYSMQMID